MAEQQAAASEQSAVDEDPLIARFPDAVVADERKGYEGYIVKTDKLVEVARALRDDFGYDYLSSVTGVDYIEDGKLEIVYHAYQIEGGTALNFKVQMDREEPVAPSLVSVYPGADFQEREVYDLFGVRFSEHPNLKRIFLWEGFPGHPLRKDFMKLPGGFSPGLQRFPNEDPDQWGGEFRAD